MNFLKTHSLGNNFIILHDAKLTSQKNLGKLAKKLCDRHKGIGADGILIALPSKRADTRMRIINSDGSEAEMCGNGILCFAKYLFEHDLIKKKKFTVETLAGLIKLELITRNNKLSSITVNMGKPVFKTQFIHYPVQILDKIYHITTILMGNPHTIIFVDTLDKEEITKIGPIIENHKLFPHRTNVDFVKIINPSKIKLITWERGVGLSMACGTGACAAVVAAHINNQTKREVTVHFEMGNLFIEWKKNNVVYMTGATPKNICEGKTVL